MGSNPVHIDSFESWMTIVAQKLGCKTHYCAQTCVYSGYETFNSQLSTFNF